MITDTVASAPAKASPYARAPRVVGTVEVVAVESGAEGTVLRTHPEQRRSQERVQAILDAAAGLIGERGIDTVTMTAIASRAAMSKAAIYRYFPTKQAIVRELVLRDFAEDRDRLADFAAQFAGDTAATVDSGLRPYCEALLGEPYRAQLRAAVHADEELARLDHDDTRTSAAELAQILSPDAQPADRRRLERRLMLIIESIDALLRLAARTPPDEIDPLIDDFVLMATGLLSPTAVDP